MLYLKYLDFAPTQLLEPCLATSSHDFATKLIIRDVLDSGAVAVICLGINSRVTGAYQGIW